MSVSRPNDGSNDELMFAVLFNDITHAPTERHVLFSTRQEIADYLWAQGWRREFRDSDYTDRST